MNASRSQHRRGGKSTESLTALMQQRWPNPGRYDLPGTTDIGGLIGKAVAELGTRIARGQWAPGATIPREVELCAQLGVSRSITREACRILAAKGMIRSRTSDGTRVLPTSSWRLLDADVLQWRLDAGHTQPLLRDLLVARLALEPGIVRMTTAVADRDGRNRIERAWQTKLALNDERAEVEPCTDRMSAEFAFHSAFFEASGAPLLSQLLPVIAASISLTRRSNGKGHDWGAHLELYAAVMKEFHAGNANGAETAMRAVIEWLMLQSETPATSAV